MAGLLRFWKAATLTVKVATVSGAIVVVGAIGNAVESTGSVQSGDTIPDPTTTTVSTTLVDTSTTTPATTTTVGAISTTTTTTTTTTTLATTTSLVLPPTSIAALAPTTTQGNCHPSYRPCVPFASDVDCLGGSGNGPVYTGRVEVVGPDVYGLDSDNDGIGCEG